jgi:transposase
MAPNLVLSQHEQIRDMTISKFTNATIARTVRCSTCSVQNIRSNLRCFGTTKAPLNGVGRRRTITPPMLSTLLEQLIEKPELYQDEIVIFLYDKFDVLVTTPSISRALASAGWSKKNIHCVAKERNADLQDFYLYNYQRSVYTT